MSAVIHLDHIGDLYPDEGEVEGSEDPKQIYWTLMTDDKENRSVIYLAHRGGPAGKYPNHGLRWGSTHKHQVLSLNPPSLVESIGWQECCGRHGYVKDGVWTPTSDSKEPVNGE